jgi:hypothetical protein
VIDIDSILAKLDSLGVVWTNEYQPRWNSAPRVGSGAGTLAIHSLDLTVAKSASSSSAEAPSRRLTRFRPWRPMPPLIRAGTNYYLTDGGADLLLKYSGSSVQVGQFGAFHRLPQRRPQPDMTSSGRPLVPTSISSGASTMTATSSPT